MSGQKSRRSFFKTAAAGTAFFASTPKAHAKRRQFKRKSPASVEMIEVGIIGCTCFSHIQNMWNVYMNPPLEEFRGGFWPRTTGMVMTMVWDPDSEAAENFAKKNDVKVVKNYYDMVDKVDAVILSDYCCTGWFSQLTKPYLEAGMPSLINRPFALSRKDAKEMVERSKKYNTPIFVPSAYESRHETLRLRFNLKKLLDDGAYITGAFANQTAGEYPGHGVHSMYLLYTVLNPNVVAANLQADTWRGFKSAFMNWKCRQKDYPDYYVGIQMAPMDYSLGWAMVLTSSGRIQEHYDRASDEVYQQLRNHNYPGIFEFAKMVETRKMPQTHDFIMDKTITFLTGFYSHIEKKGAMVNCDDLPEDWRAPDWKPDRIPDEIFR